MTKCNKTCKTLTTDRSHIKSKKTGDNVISAENNGDEETEEKLNDEWYEEMTAMRLNV